MKDDLRQGVTPAGHDVLDAADRIRTANQGEPRLRQLRILSSYARLQSGYISEPTMPAADRRLAAVEGAAALLLVAELLQLEGEG